MQYKKGSYLLVGFLGYFAVVAVLLVEAAVPADANVVVTPFSYIV